ncbi:hypothetical protein HDU67_000979, partial [Dinochytrium kinnereticum]
MTMNAVPTSNPDPKVESSISFSSENWKASGMLPARKEPRNMEMERSISHSDEEAMRGCVAFGGGG